MGDLKIETTSVKSFLRYLRERLLIFESADIDESCLINNKMLLLDLEETCQVVSSIVSDGDFIFMVEDDAGTRPRPIGPIFCQVVDVSGNNTNTIFAIQLCASLRQLRLSGEYRSLDVRRVLSRWDPLEVLNHQGAKVSLIPEITAEEGRTLVDNNQGGRDKEIKLQFSIILTFPLFALEVGADEPAGMKSTSIDNPAGMKSSKVIGGAVEFREAPKVDISLPTINATMTTQNSSTRGPTNNLLAALSHIIETTFSRAPRKVLQDNNVVAADEQQAAGGAASPKYSNNENNNNNNNNSNNIIEKRSGPSAGPMGDPIMGTGLPDAGPINETNPTFATKVGDAVATAFGGARRNSICTVFGGSDNAPAGGGSDIRAAAVPAVLSAPTSTSTGGTSAAARILGDAVAAALFEGGAAGRGGGGGGGTTDNNDNNNNNGNSSNNYNSAVGATTVGSRTQQQQQPQQQQTPHAPGRTTSLFMGTMTRFISAIGSIGYDRGDRQQQQQQQQRSSSLPAVVHPITSNRTEPQNNLNGIAVGDVRLPATVLADNNMLIQQGAGGASPHSGSGGSSINSDAHNSMVSMEFSSTSTSPTAALIAALAGGGVGVKPLRSAQISPEDSLPWVAEESSGTMGRRTSGDLLAAMLGINKQPGGEIIGINKQQGGERDDTSATMFSPFSPLSVITSADTTPGFSSAFSPPGGVSSAFSPPGVNLVPARAASTRKSFISSASKKRQVMPSPLSPTPQSNPNEQPLVPVVMADFSQTRPSPFFYKRIIAQRDQNFRPELQHITEGFDEERSKAFLSQTGSGRVGGARSSPGSVMNSPSTFLKAPVRSDSIAELLLGNAFLDDEMVKSKLNDYSVNNSLSGSPLQTKLHQLQPQIERQPQQRQSGTTSDTVTEQQQRQQQ